MREPLKPASNLRIQEMSVMVESLRPIAKLRVLLAEVEDEFGLDNLSLNERDVLYAFLSEGAGSNDSVGTNEVRDNSILRDMSDPTLYRNILSLMERGILSLAPGRRRGAYVIRDLDLSETN